LGGWALLLLFLHSACATGVPRGGLLAGHRAPSLTPRFHTEAPPPTTLAETWTEQEEEEEEAADGPVHLTLSARFPAVQVSRFELHQALSSLVLHTPLRVAGARPPLYLLARASAPLSGEAWRTPLAQAYGRFCERCGTPGDCLSLFQDWPGLDGEDKRDLALALSLHSALDSLDAELRGMFSTSQLFMTLSLTVIGYLALVAAPEPVSRVSPVPWPCSCGATWAGNSST
jgi:hypothetical protein